MLKAQSDYFFRNIGNSAARLDYLFHHPRYDKVKEVVKSDLFLDLGSLIEEGSMQYGITESGKDTGETAFVNIENLETSGKINQDGIRYVDDVPPEMLLEENDILISRSRLVGVCAVASESEKNCTFGSYIIRFKVNKDEIAPMYLAKFLNSKLGQAQVDYLQTGSSGNNINTDQIKAIRILYIDPELQANLVKEVIKLEDKATSIELKIDKIRQISNRLLMEELGFDILAKPVQYFYDSGKDERSPYFVINSSEVPESNRINFTFHDPKTRFIDQLNKYSTIPLEDVCVSLNRGEQPEYDPEGDALVIKTVDLKNAFIDYENCLRVSHDFYANNPSAQIGKGNVLVSSTGYMSLGKVDIFDQNYRAIADGHVSILRLKDGYDPYFLTYFLRSDFGKMQFEKWWTGSSGQIELQRDDLASFRIPDNNERTGIPLKRQQEIATKITRSLKEIEQLENDRKHLIMEARHKFEGFIGEQIQKINDSRLFGQGYLEVGK
jgi:type I restriction enzyme S subunit